MSYDSEELFSMFYIEIDKIYFTNFEIKSEEISSIAFFEIE